MMRRINTATYMRSFRAYLQGQGITQLTEPDATEENLYCAMQVDRVEPVNFKCVWWNPAVAALARAIIEQDSGKYYALGVYSNDSGFIELLSSRGLLTSRACDECCVIEGDDCVQEV